VSHAAPGDAHRARLFPLPLVEAVERRPCRSARTLHRLKVHEAVVGITNATIHTLNNMYSSPSPSSRPDNTQLFVSPRPSCPPSAAQQRVLAHLQQRSWEFVQRLRTPAHTGDRETTLSLDMLLSIAHPPCMQHAEAAPSSTTFGAPALGPSDGPNLFFLSPSTHSTTPSAAVPLIAERVGLPSKLRIVPLLEVLPPELACTLSKPGPALLRPAGEVASLLQEGQKLPRPRVIGSRAEYLKLVRRMHSEGMLRFHPAAAAVNGPFTVAKDTDTDRLIIDARFANVLFVDPPHVPLCGPSHLVQLHLPEGAVMYVAKSDLSNFYHHLGLPEWLQPYFALPPLRPEELAALGLPRGAPFPCCTTMPMGWSHAVHIAQAVHQYVLYRAKAVHPEDNLLCMLSPSVSATRVIHGLVVDDFFLFCLDLALASRVFDAVLAAYRHAGFVVKDSKIVRPTLDAVKVIGFDIDGRTGIITLPRQSQASLVRATLTVLRARTVPGTLLAHIVGRWTWVMMLRRPSLAVLQQCYRYCDVARGAHFTLWRSARRELEALLTLLPLLTARLGDSFFVSAIASDASELAAGVVTARLTPQLHSQLWPLCSTRHRMVRQARLNTDAARDALPSLAASMPGHADVLSSAAFDAYYACVLASPWRTLVSQAWRDEEHINSLELRAALLAIHWVLSRGPRALGRRVYLLLDSSVAFFTVWKGRSSSPRLLLVLRKINALLLAGGLTLLPGWLPSAVNPADAPSRLQASGPQGLLLQ